ncbi:DNA alkylation repair protein [archaeon]|jgi:3-methyladenine DNA glycosylase AlkD|nr:DNA alkylation repair protein [archaeon]
MLNNLLKELQLKANPEKAKIYQRFFKTGDGHYGAGDIFLGLTMPEQRGVSNKYTDLSFSNIQKLLNSKIHEHRMSAGVILTNKFKQKPVETFNFYIKNAKKFNNWDLVDVTCTKIIGKFLLDKDRKILYDLAKSKNLWEKRISIVSTFAFIRKNELGDTLKISEILLKDKHDLIHKAIGWMLREVGKKDKEVLVDFLKTNYKNIPRTTLRYSIERFPENERKRMLKGEFK